MLEIKKNLWLQIVVIYTRYLMGGAFVFASLIKIKGKRFTTVSGIDEPINSAWHLFETLYQSGLYWQFIGIGQLITGFLLMTQRYAKLGALINFPIVINVFVITISYYFAFTPFITALMLIGNIFLIAWDWDELKVVINLTPEIETQKRLERDLSWEVTGLLLFFFTLSYRIIIDGYNLFFWFLVFLIIGIIGFIIGISRRRLY